MATHYSFSKLEKTGRDVTVHSRYVHHETWPSYVVRLIILKKGKVRYASDLKTFAHIDRAEGFHQELVLHLADRGYKLVNSSAK
jgi:hypothetical protein